jgi:nicotinate-nucleotide adenylyltransferase
MHRIGLFGGSFDPVHLGHLALATTALASVGLDQVLWIPAGQPWQKAGSRTLAAALHRAAMVSLAIAGEPRFRLETSEIRRVGPSYTIDTVRELQDAGAMLRPEWFLLLGQDQYARLSTWRAWRELLQRVTLAVAARDGDEPQPDPALRQVPHRRLAIPMPAMPVSSTAIRARVAAGASLAGLVPPAVAAYIAEHGLYRVSPGTPDPGATPTPETSR